jgi:PhzF family phenazine biosynthesis protein
MRVPIYQFDAFARPGRFTGNPAAVCPLEQWLDAETMQAIAMENNLSETAFFVREGGDYAIRWFTPAAEIDLCGHATLASAHLVLRADPGRERVTFHSKSGPLAVSRAGDRLVLDFPSRPAVEHPANPALAEALGTSPREVWKARDLVAVFEGEDEVRALAPDMKQVMALGVHAVIATAPGRDSDYVLRFFAPLMGVPEDPATGSAQCTLVPFWAKRLGRPRLHGLQLSPRGAEFWCEDQGERVAIGGRVAEYLEGTIEV